MFKRLEKAFQDTRIFDDKHIDGLKKLTDEIRKYNSLSVAQSHHAGMRSIEEIIGERPVCPSADDKTKSRALDNNEVNCLIDDFVKAATELRNLDMMVLNYRAHGYILCQFLSSTPKRG